VKTEVIAAMGSITNETLAAVTENLKNGKWYLKYMNHILNMFLCE
jgi:hypothetical protein